jgi:Pentapeptide repeats (8 copies)
VAGSVSRVLGQRRLGLVCRALGQGEPACRGSGWRGFGLGPPRQARTATNRHYEQTRADQQRRLTESFSKAVEQLSDRDKIEARLGGIYTLERLAIEAIAQVRSPPWWRRLLLRRNQPPPADPVSDLYWTVMETLTAFVRERARWEEPEPPAPEMAAPRQERPAPATDIAAVLEVLRRRPQAGRERERETLRGWRLDLQMTDLRGASLIGAYLEGTRLGGAHLEGANLIAVGLEGANLIEAHLERAVLGWAHLAGADLRGAHLDGADLHGAHLDGAILQGAHLEGVDLSGAIGDAKTRLPDSVARPAGWPPYAP